MVCLAGQSGRHAAALRRSACRHLQRPAAPGARRLSTAVRVAAGNGTSANGTSSRRTAYVYEELLMWHCPGPWGNLGQLVQPMQYPEHAETKRRLHNLVSVSGLLEQLQPLKARPATVEQLARAHSLEYIQAVQALSSDASKAVHRVGDETAFMPGGYEVAALSAGAALTATDEVLGGGVSNAYALSRPPGHHAERQMGGGYCVFNNVAVAAAHALDAHGLARVAVVDFDVHHGNGTQQIFWDDGRVLFISLHQDSNYPLGSGPMSDVGGGAGRGTTLNVPLPPGSGSGAYRAAFERLVVPALDAFAPQLILVSAGYDASYMDPLGQMMLGSEDYRFFIAALQAAAPASASGRLVVVHEGGYSELYVPFCGLAVIEQLVGAASKLADPYWPDVSGYGYQGLQPHQDAVIAAAEAQLLPLVKEAAARVSGSGSRRR